MRAILLESPGPVRVLQPGPAILKRYPIFELLAASGLWWMHEAFVMGYSASAVEYLDPTETDNPAGETRAGRSRLSATRLFADLWFLALESRALWSARLVVCFCVLSGLTLAVYQKHREQPIFDASAEILLQPVDSTALTLVYSGSAKKAAVDLPVEAQIFLSDTVLGRVAKDLDLANDPRFSPLAHRGYHLDANRPEIRAAMIAELRLGLAVRYDILRSDNVSGNNDGWNVTGRTSKTRQLSGPRIMVLSFTGRDPQVAAAILKREIQVYADRNFELRHDAVMRVAARLTSSMDTFKSRVESEQRTLFEFERRSGIVGPAGDRNPDATVLLELTRQQSFAQEQVRSQQAAADASAQGAYLAGPADTVLVLQSAVNLAQLELAEQESTLGPEYPTIRELQARKAELLLELAQARARFENRVEEDLRLARTQNGLISAAIRHKSGLVNVQHANAAKATTLQVQLQRDSELYYVLVNNVRTAMIDAGFGSVGVTMLKQPDVPERPRARGYLRRAVLYALAGLLVGLLFVVLLTYWSDATGLDGQYLLPAPSIAEVPWIGEIRKSSSPLVLLDPGLKFSQAIFSLRDALLLAPSTRTAKRVVFAGIDRGQGTTTIAINTAIALAQTGLCVLLIDADSHNPSIHRRLRLEARQGLSAVFSGQSSLVETAIALPGVPGLAVLAPGPMPSHGTGMAFDSPRMRMLMEEAAQSYDYVVIDTSFAETPEAAPLLELADLALLVVRTGNVSRRGMRHAAEAVKQSTAGLIGVIRCT